MNGDLRPTVSRVTIQPVMGEEFDEEQRLVLQQMDMSFREQRRNLLRQIIKLEEDLNKYHDKKVAAANRSTHSHLSYQSETERPERHQKLIHDNVKWMTSAVRYNSEYEMSPYEFYNGTHVMSSLVGMGVGQIKELGGLDAVALQEVLSTSKDFLIAPMPDNDTLPPHPRYVHNVHRFTPTVGDKYEIYFRSMPSRMKVGMTQLQGDQIGNHSYSYGGITKYYTDNDYTFTDTMVKLTLAHPFGPISLLKVSSGLGTTHINIILPISSSGLDSLQQFISQLDYPTETYNTLSLTVVYFGQGDKINILRLIPRRTIPIYLVMLDEPLSSMSALRAGANRWNDSNVILLSVDVGAIITEDGLRRCRYHTTQGQSVYYPMVFSLYNPNLVYEVIHKEIIPPLSNQLRINSDKGRWQHEHYGVSCQFRTDFLAMSGHIEPHLSDPDRALYVTYIQSMYKVHRIPDHGFFHLYHAQHCVDLPQKQQFIKCLLSKTYSAGSHTHLGFLVFDKNAAQTQTE